MKRLLIVLIALMLSPAVWSAEVAVGTSANDLRSMKQARDFAAYADAHGITTDNAPRSVVRLLEDNAETLAHLTTLPDDPTNAEINDALAILTTDSAVVIFWQETNPAITCADLDNAVLIAENFCVRISATAVSAAVNPGIGIRASCDSGAVIRIKCP